MPGAIAEFCRRTRQPVPEKKGEFVRCIYESLAFKYRFLIDKINAMCPEPVEVLHVVGGGSRNEMLNRFSADATGLRVVAGPAEATAVGNIIIQAITKNVVSSIEEGRKVVSRSFPLKTYKPQNKNKWNSAYEKVKGMFS